MIIGAQLFTLRNYTQNLSSFSDTLKRVKEIGYDAVQVSGTCAYDAEWLADELDKYGLVCALTHIPYERIKDETDKVIKEHKTFGCRYVGLGSRNSLISRDDLSDVISLAKTAGAKLASNGLCFTYHNHIGEFIRNEKRLCRIDELLEATSPDECKITLDTYWLSHAGCDVEDWILKLSGRIDCVHFKDKSVVDKSVRMAPVGSGNMNWEKYIAACRKSGTKYILVEQDDCYEDDPFECLKKSYLYLKSMGL